MPRARPRSKTIRTAALYKEHVFVDKGRRTVRISAYTPREDQETGVILGIGYGDPDAFARIAIELTPETWRAITKHVRKAFNAAELETQRANLELASELNIKRSKASKSSTTPPPPKPAKPPTGTRKIHIQAEPDPDPTPEPNEPTTPEPTPDEEE